MHFTVSKIHFASNCFTCMDLAWWLLYLKDNFGLAQGFFYCQTFGLSVEISLTSQNHHFFCKTACFGIAKLISKAAKLSILPMAPNIINVQYSTSVNKTKTRFYKSGSLYHNQLAHFLQCQSNFGSNSILPQCKDNQIF